MRAQGENTVVMIWLGVTLAASMFILVSGEGDNCSGQSLIGHAKGTVQPDGLAVCGRAGIKGWEVMTRRVATCRHGIKLE